MTGWPHPLGAAALQGPAGEFVELVEPHTEADPAAGDHHLQRRLADVEAIALAGAGLVLVGDHHRDRGSRVCDMPAASPHPGDLTQHLPGGHDDELPRLVVSV